MSHKIVILGGGATGLSAAYILSNSKIKDFHVFEKNSYTGGLCHTFKDSKNFLFDIGGHVIYSKNDLVNSLLDKMMGKEWVYHLKESFVILLNSWIPYPFQLNLHSLSKELCFECVKDFLNKKENITKENFLEWLYSAFGNKITDFFMRPYNEKLWKHALSDIGTYWTDERICIPSLEQIIKNIIFENNDFNFGCDYKFRYPLRGGVGEIFKRLSNLFPENLHLNKNVIQIDPIDRIIYFDDNSSIKYDYLISTMPITKLVNVLKDNVDLKNAAENLKHNSVAVTGIGFNKPSNIKASWMYFPESKYPFYRLSHYSMYSHHNVENLDNQFSVIAESAFNSSEKIDENILLQKVIEALKEIKIIDLNDEEKIASTFFYNIDCAYPIPTKERDIHLNYINLRLEQLNIFSRGRFGSFKYEKSNIESSMLEGFSIAEKILRQKLEKI